MTGETPGLTLDRGRVSALLERLEQMAAGDRQTSLAISPLHDELDAITFGINVLADELRWTHERMTEAERVKAEALRRSKEEADRANESKSVFLRNASHEIRTPIAVILSIAELLALPDLSSQERADLVAKLRANSQAVLSLVGNLLDLSRLEAGRLSLIVEPVSPLALVREVVQSLEPHARAKGLSVRVDDDGSLPAAVDTDQLRLRQILVNIVGNALKFTEQGGVRIALTSTPSHEVEELRVDVVDTGIGIPSSRRRHLFEPFEQADPPLSRAGGTGLGLAISRRLAEQLGGSLVLLHSHRGTGSTFRLTIKARRAKTSLAGPGARAARSPDPRHPLAGVRILLAEDSPDLQVAIRRLLTSTGASVDGALDGREAMEMALSGSYDVVLMDIRLPKVSGIEAARELRRLGYRVPIIALTADATDESRLASVAAGCGAVLTKPFEVDRLIEAIWALCDRGDNDAGSGAQAT